MAITDVDPLLAELTRLECNPSLPSFLTDQIKKLQLELRFLKMFFWCFAKWDDAAKDARVGPFVTNIAVQLRKAGQGLYAAGLIAIQRDQTDNWNILALNFLEKVELFKPEIAEICRILLNHSFQCNFSTSYEILDFISTILENLKDLVNSKAIINGPIEMRIRELEQILWVLKSFVDFTATRAITYEKLEDFWNHVQGCTNRAASVSFLFWVGERAIETNKSKIDGVLSDLLQKIEPFTPEAIEMYFGVLKDSKISRSDTSLLGEVVASFIDFLLKNLQFSMKDDISVLTKDLMFLIVFLMDPPELSETGGKLIWTKIDDILIDVASFICSFRVDQTREKQNKSPLELFQRIDKVKAEIKELYVQISDSSLSDFPKTNGLGYINFLLAKIDELLKCDANVKTFARYQIVTIQKELVRLESFLKLRNEHNQLETVWMQIINVAYRAEHAIDTSLITDAPLWCHMIRLSDVTEQMKLIKLDVEKMELIAQTSAIASSWRMDTLELGYKHMPDVLKSCFLYFATFQKGIVIKVKRLCRLWIAEGFVPKTEGKSLEDVANEYLMDLISGNLVTVDNRSFSERIKECHVHDPVHSFCVTKAEEEGFLQLVNTSGLQPNGIRYNQYRLCIHSEWRHFVNSRPTGPNVRSLLFHPDNFSNKHPCIPEVFISFQFLTVLDLEGLSWGVLFPEEFVSLTHLRYLAVAGDFTSIPSSIDKLSYLETLYLQSHDSIIVLPDTICNMKMLRHVDIPTGAVVSWDDYDIEMSSCLHYLFTFSSLFISPREDAEMLLKMLLRVRRLRFQFYNQFPAVDFLDNLESLKVHKVGRAPCSYLSNFPSTLRELTLSNLGLPWREMSAIAKLPNFEALKLLSRSFEGWFWYIRKDEFLKLKFLKLESLNITEWRAEDGSLPCLQRLVVKDCVKLVTIPHNFGYIDTLNITEVHECSSPVTESARKIFQEQQNRGNVNIQTINTPKVAEEHSSSSREGGLSKMSVKQRLPLRRGQIKARIFKGVKETFKEVTESFIGNKAFTGDKASSAPEASRPAQKDSGSESSVEDLSSGSCLSPGSRISYEKRR